MVKVHAITMFDDIQRHPAGCHCGRCEPAGRRSFGVAIILVPDISEEGLERAVLSKEDPIERVYAPSPNEAREKAKERLIELGYIFWGDI